MARNSGQWGGDPGQVYGKGWNGGRASEHHVGVGGAADSGAGSAGALAGSSALAIAKKEAPRRKAGAGDGKDSTTMITRVFELYENEPFHGEAHLFELDDGGSAIWSSGYRGEYAAAHALVDVHTALAVGVSPCAEGWGRGTHANGCRAYDVYIRCRIQYKGVCAARWKVRSDGYITVEFDR